MSCVGKACGSCGDRLTYNRSRGKTDCNLTAQRVNNNEARHMENVTLLLLLQYGDVEPM